MEKRYQVFISSTFQDLQNARQEVSQALLRADCFPAGMELFPAADEEQFEFIKTVIDQSDYYIIISAGRYGSIHSETGLSYTEMEYDYAVETGKPVIRLLHKDPFNELKGELIEKTDKGKKKLELFRAKMSAASLVKFWSEPKELGAEVVFSLLDAKNRFPEGGWVPAETAMSLEDIRELSHLREENRKLDAELRSKLDEAERMGIELDAPMTQKLVGFLTPKTTAYAIVDYVLSKRSFEEVKKGVHDFVVKSEDLNFSPFSLSDRASRALIQALEQDELLVDKNYSLVLNTMTWSIGTKAERVEDVAALADFLANPNDEIPF